MPQRILLSSALFLAACSTASSTGSDPTGPLIDEPRAIEAPPLTRSDHQENLVFTETGVLQQSANGITVRLVHVTSADVSVTLARDRAIERAKAEGVDIHYDNWRLDPLETGSLIVDVYGRPQPI